MNNDKFKFNVGDKVYSKFRGKWCVGVVEFALARGKERFYKVSFNTAKRFQKRYEDEMREFVDFKQMEFDFSKEEMK